MWSNTRDLLELGHPVSFGETVVRKVDKPLEPGCKYVAERNTGPELLTLSYINVQEDWVVPLEENKYWYDLHECVRVEVVEEPNGSATFN